MSHHPYKRAKHASPEKQRVINFWHVQHSKKFGATFSCPFRCTTQCLLKIKYTIKNATLSVLILSEHDHSNEVRVSGLSIDKAAKVHKGKFLQVCLDIIFYLFEQSQIHNLTFEFCTVVKQQAIHIEVNKNHGNMCIFHRPRRM